MTQTPEHDPTRHWDGQRWMKWDGTSWQPEQPLPTVAAAPAPAVRKPRRGNGLIIAVSMLALFVAGILIGRGSVSTPAAPTPAGAVGQPTAAGQPSSQPVASQPAAGPVTLLDTSGNGIKDLPRFTATGDWTMTYTFDCSAFGQAGNFQVTDAGDNFGVYANQLAMTGGDSTSEQNTGAVKLSVNSECAWTLKATQP